MKRIALRSLLILAAVAIGLATGFALRPKPMRVSSGSASLTRNEPETGKTRLRVGPRPPGAMSLATKLERDLSTSSGVTRWLYWLEAIEQAQPGDFPRLARLAQNDPAALRFVSARWAESYPRQLFDTLVESLKNPGSLPVNELANSLFKEWPKRDPDAAIEALSGAENFGLRGSWRDLVAASVIENDAERGLRLMADWNIDRFGPRMTAVAKWAEANPRHAAEFTLEYPAGYVSELTMETIAKEWAKTDPASALEFAATRPGELALTLATATLKAWAGRNLDEAAHWLTQADERTRNSLSSALVEPWAKQDAQAALAWCESSLSGSSLIHAVSAVIKGAADTDLSAAAALVASLNPSSARAEAAVAVAKKWFPELSGSEPVKPETLAWLRGLDANSVKRVLDEVQWSWATSDPTSMAAFLLSPNAEQVPTSAYTILARQIAGNNPLAAFDWARSLSTERGLAAGSEAYAAWRTAQPEAATQWLNALQADDPRVQPYFESAIRSIAWNDPQATAQLATLPPTERAAARGVIEKMTLPEDRRASLMSALTQR